jgi:hypothetical protein
LVRFGINSNGKQIKYKKICKALTNSQLHAIYEFIFEQQVAKNLEELIEKDSCNWSRELVTAVIDDSVFKQWLQQNTDTINSFEECYGRFFSGQIGKAVFGYQVATFGLSIDGVFYPMYFECVKKKDILAEPEGKTDECKQEKQTIKVAQKLLNKWGNFIEKQKKAGIIIPKIHLSCDSGYSNVELSNDAFAYGLIYISVPKKNHYFTINNIRIRLDNWINEKFVITESIHNENEKGLKNEDKTPFTMRFRAFYHCQNRNVTLLAFRLNGSKKVSVIYSTDKNIKAKTLRRHWFQRTYIEQFFKLLKHYLKIQMAVAPSKHDFECKLLRFAFIGMQIQFLVQFIRTAFGRKHFKEFRNKGFGTIQMLMKSDKHILDNLEDLLK